MCKLKITTQQLKNTNAYRLMGQALIFKSHNSLKVNKNKKNSTRKNPFYLIFLFIIILIVASCKDNSIKDDEDSLVDHIEEEESQASASLEEDYYTWFQLQNKYIESFNLIIKKMKLTENQWGTTELLVALVENITDTERGGFFVAKDIYFPINALNEIITTLENIDTQIKNDNRKYSCTRRYTTSYGVLISFQYSSSENKWNNIKIFYNSDEYPIKINHNYLMSYINGLKDCRQTINDFKTGEINNYH